MKIGVVTEKYPPRSSQGGPKSASLLTEGLRRLGHEVEVLSFSRPHSEDAGYVHRKKLSTSRSDRMQLQARPHIKKFASGKDIIHGYNRVFDPAIGTISTPSVCTINNFMFDYPRRVPGKNENPSFPPYRAAYNTVARAAIRRNNKFIALSDHLKRYYASTIPEDRIRVIPNMYDPDFPEFSGIETDQKEILYVGALRKHKGVQELVEEFSDLEANYSLRIVGDGPQRQCIEQKAREFGIGSRVHFEGYVKNSELAKYYEKAGIFVHPGLWPEPFGRTIMEAMQMETPVIATNRGGPGEILPDRQLFDEYNLISSLVERIDRGKAVERQNRIITRYKPEEVTESIEDLYKRLHE